MSLVPGGIYVKEFTTSNPTTGAAQNADSLPVATANHNGTDDGAFILTVLNLDTGRYKITGTVPAYSKSDVLNVSVAATVAAIAGKAIVDTQIIDSKQVGDLHDSAYSGADTAGTATLLTRVPGTVQPQTGDSFARIGAPVGASISADIQSSVGVALYGIVAASPAPSTTAFNVTLNKAISGSAIAANFIGLYVWFFDVDRNPVAAQKIKTCTILSTTSLSLTTDPFSVAPANPEQLAIST